MGFLRLPSAASCSFTFFQRSMPVTRRFRYLVHASGAAGSISASAKPVFASRTVTTSRIGFLTMPSRMASGSL